MTLYRSIPEFLRAVRTMAERFGRKSLVSWQDPASLQLGFQVGDQVHAVQLSVFRHHYDIRRDIKLPEGVIQLRSFGTRSMQEGIALYLRDLELAMSGQALQ